MSQDVLRFNYKPQVTDNTDILHHINDLCGEMTLRSGYEEGTAGRIPENENSHSSEFNNFVKDQPDYKQISIF